MAGVSKRSIVVDARAHRLGLFVRLALRRGLLLPESPRLLLLAQQNEIPTVLAAWQRVPHRQRLSPVDVLRLQGRLEQLEQPLLVAVSSEMRRDSSQRLLLESLEMRDPRVVRSMSVLRLFEQQQERLPPVFMGDVPFMTTSLGIYFQCSGPAQATGRPVGGGPIAVDHDAVHGCGGLADLARGSWTRFLRSAT